MRTWRTTRSAGGWFLPLALLAMSVWTPACFMVREPIDYGGQRFDGPAKDARSAPRFKLRASLVEAAIEAKATESFELFDVESGFDKQAGQRAWMVANKRTREEPVAGDWVRFGFPSGVTVDRQLDAGGSARLDLSEVPVDAFFPMTFVAVVSVPGRAPKGNEKEAVVSLPADEKAIARLPAAVRQRAENLANAARSARERLREAEARYRDAVSGPEAALRDLTEANRPYSIQGEVIETRENVIVLKGHATIYGRQGEGSIINGYIAVYNYDKRVLANHNYQFYIGQHYFRGPIYERVWLMQSGPIMTYGDMPPDARRKIEPAEARLRKAQSAASPAYEEAKRVCAEAEAGYRAMLPTDPFGLFPEPPEKKTKGGKK